MKVFSRLFLIGFLLLVGIHTTTAQPSLEDFGHRIWAAPAERNTLVILVNFTNVTPVLTTNVWDPVVFSTNSVPQRVNGYFTEVSNGRFRLKRGGTIAIDQPAANRWQAWKDRLGDPGLADLHYHSNIMHQAILSGQFNFKGYDEDEDGYVESHELLVLILAHENNILGGVRGAGTVAPAGRTGWKGNVSTADLDRPSWFTTICHELSHLLGAKDLYGIWSTDEDLNSNLSIMSSGLVHPDAWHKMRFGWSDPQRGNLATGGVARLWAQQAAQTNASLILFDPATERSKTEFFLLEYRTRTNASVNWHYEQELPGDGLVIWHVYHDASRNPVQHAGLVYPTAQSGWRECRHCRSLIHLSVTNKPCASPRSTNGMHFAFVDDHRLVKDDASYTGEPGWRHCSKCAVLYYHPNRFSSVCKADQGWHADSGWGDYRIPVNVPDVVGHNNGMRCTNCQALFYEGSPNQFGNSACPATNAPNGWHAGHTNRYVLIADWSHITVMTEGAYPVVNPTQFLLAGNGLWTAGRVTPRLRWFDGTPAPYRLYVRPFNLGDGSITVEWWNESDYWVDFAYSGLEQGTFTRPWNTLAEGVTAIPHGGTLNIKTGRSTETARITKRMKMQAYGGPVILGR